MYDFLTKFFSMDSVFSRFVRGAILAALPIIAAGGQIDWKVIVLSGLAAVAGFIPAGQNNPAPVNEKQPVSVARKA